MMNLPSEATSLIPPPMNFVNGESNPNPTSYSVILYMANNGARINEADKYGLSPLHHAAMRGNDDAAKELLSCPDIDIEVHKTIFGYKLVAHIEILLEIYKYVLRYINNFTG